MENIDEYLFNMIKDNIERKIYLNLNIASNVDESPLILESNTGTTIEKKDKKLLLFIPLGKAKKEFLVFNVFLEMG